jgi:hypothetical protein
VWYTHWDRIHKVKESRLVKVEKRHMDDKGWWKDVNPTSKTPSKKTEKR